MLDMKGASVSSSLTVSLSIVVFESDPIAVGSTPIFIVYDCQLSCLGQRFYLGCVQYRSGYVVLRSFLSTERVACLQM